jgi:hypothetical protein
MSEQARVAKEQIDKSLRNPAGKLFFAAFFCPPKKSG